MKPAPFKYHLPKTVAQAAELLQELAPEDGRIIAGGQSLLPMMALRLARPQHLIDINRIPGLDGITMFEGRLRIGATVRHATIERRAAAGGLIQFLAGIARHIAHPPIRSRGTFCGSIANSDPASEWCLAAVALDADVMACSSRGLRPLAAKSFFHGPMTNALAPDEIVTEVQIPMLTGSARCGFYEVARVSGGFAMAAAIVVYQVENRRIAAAHIGIAGVEAAPRRLRAAEAVLDGMEISRLDVERVAQAAALGIAPSEGGPLSDTFRRHLTRTVTARALQQTLS